MGTEIIKSLLSCREREFRFKFLGILWKAFGEFRYKLKCENSKCRNKEANRKGQSKMKTQVENDKKKPKTYVFLLFLFIPTVQKAEYTGAYGNSRVMPPALEDGCFLVIYVPKRSAPDTTSVFTVIPSSPHNFGCC